MKPIHLLMLTIPLFLSSCISLYKTETPKKSIHFVDNDVTDTKVSYSQSVLALSMTKNCAAKTIKSDFKTTKKAALSDWQSKVSKLHGWDHTNWEYASNRTMTTRTDSRRGVHADILYRYEGLPCKDESQDRSSYFQIAP